MDVSSSSLRSSSNYLSPWLRSSQADSSLIHDPTPALNCTHARTRAVRHAQVLAIRAGVQQLTQAFSQGGVASGTQSDAAATLVQVCPLLLLF